MPTSTECLRAAGRLVGFLAFSVAACADFVVRGDWRSVERKAQWTHRWAHAMAWILGVEVRPEGAPAGHAVIVSNHVSYLDIVVHAHRQPVVFVSKAEVRWWPVLGALAACGGTIFIDRERRADVARVNDVMRRIVGGGVPVVFFPEGTSGSGREVLPFRPALFAVAAAEPWPVVPMWVGYELEDGDVSEEVCYWRDMTFLPHFLNLLTKKRIIAHLRSGPPLAPAGDRKQLAQAAHHGVSMLQRLPPVHPHPPAGDAL